MCKEILKDLKNNKTLFIMLLLVFIIVMFISSLSISFLYINKDIVVDYNRGDINKQKILDIKSSTGDYLDINKIIDTCNKFTKENSLDIKGFSYRKKDETNNKTWIIPVELVSIGENNQWNPSVTSGRYFNKNELNNNEKVAVVGSSIVKNKIFNADTVDISNDKFTVIGQVGKININSDYISTIFIPLNSAPEAIKKNVKELQIRIYNEKEIKNQAQLLFNELHSKSDLHIEEIKSDNNTLFYKSLLETIGINLLIITIVIINIIMFVSYYLNKEISCLNELKNFKVNISKSKLFYIIISLSFLAILASLAIQTLVNPLIKSNFTEISNIDSLSITYVNIIILLMISFILSLITFIFFNNYENAKKIKLLLIKSKKVKKIIYTLELIITFTCLNIILFIVCKTIYLNREFNSVLDCNNAYNISINADKNISLLENLNKKFTEIKNNEEVQKYGRYYFDKIKVNTNEYRGLFIDNIDIYKFDITGSQNFSRNSNTISILVSEDLSNTYNIGDIIKLSINNNDVPAKVVGLIKKSKFLSGNLESKEPIENIKNTFVIPFDQEYFYDKNIDYAMFNNIIFIGNSSNFEKTLENFKNTNLISSYSRCNTFVENIKSKHMVSSGFLALIALIFFVFSLAGVIGANSCYRLFSNHKFIIKTVFFILVFASFISILVYKYLF